jgi:MFS family permease
MRKRYLVLGMLVFLSAVTYLDRVCISFAGMRMQRDLDLSPDQWGWVLSVFAVAYGLFEIPTGALGDRFGQRKTILRIVVWWSAFTALTGLAWSLPVLLIVRFLFGVGEAGAYPNMSGSIGRWFPPTERARAQGFVWGASRLGGALAPLLVVPLMQWIGWRNMFLSLGLIGVAWAVAWRAWYHDNPADHPGMTAEELSEIGPSAHARGHRDVPWARLIRNRQLWLIMLMYWCYVWGSMFYLTWMPQYLVKGRGLSEEQMKLFSGLPFVMGTIGNLAGGFLCDYFSRRLGLTHGRRLIGCASLVGASLLLLATALTTGQASGVILLALGFGLMDCMLPTAWATCTDIGQHHAGAVTGAMNSAGQAGGFVCTVLFGYLVSLYGDYNLALFPIAAMVFAAGMLFLWIDPARPLLTAPATVDEEHLACV